MSARSITCTLVLLLVAAVPAQAQTAVEPSGLAGPAAHASSISVLLQRRQELGLSPEQIRTLERLSSQLQKDTLRQSAAIQIAELELLELQSGEALDAARVKSKLIEIGEAHTALRVNAISIARQATDVLSPAQRQRVGALLVAAPLGSNPSLESDLRQRIQATLRGELRDQKVVEVETTEAIVDRLIGMGKLLLLIGGIPLAVLSVFGVRKLTNLTAVLKLVQKQLGEAREQVEATRTQAHDLLTQQADIKQTAGELEIQYGKIRDDAHKAVLEISSVQMRVAEEGEKATVAIRTTAEAFNDLHLSQTEAKPKAPAKPAWPADGSVLTIPVVVHVVYNTEHENISDAQIRSQIDVLNKDFRAKNPDIANVPEPFKPLIGDARIEFTLATEDPLGNPTSGITRDHTKRKGFGADGQVASATKGGAKAWEPARYLNIWVCQLTGGILSSSQTPGGSKEWDGVVISHNAFGTIGTAQAPFNRGRTATAGIAKYLNLRNLWSEDCKDSDLVSDTPPQKGPNFGKPQYPHISCENGPNGDMFMNFMDYVDDEVMCMFTKGQVTRMQKTLRGPRRQLGRS